MPCEQDDPTWLTPRQPARARRRARSRARRTPRSALGDWEPPADRTKPVEILKDQDRTRVPELVPIRHGRMGASAFTFYRGAAGIMAEDLAAEPEHGPCRTALRRRAPVQLRGLRGPRPEADLRHQRLRRDASGAVRMGRQAAGRELRDRRPGSRLQGEGPAGGRRRGGRGVPAGDAAARLDAHDRRLVPAARRRRPSSSTDDQVKRKAARTPTRRSRRQRARTACGRSRSSRIRLTVSCASSATPR